MRVKTVCMDCGTTIVEGPLSKDGLISDGLCPPCAVIRKRELELQSIIRNESLIPIKLRLGDRIQYTTSSEDDHPVSPGTTVYGTIVGRRLSTLNVKWDKLGITEYGIPEELLVKVERR